VVVQWESTKKNKKVFNNFSQDTFEKILILSVDEIFKINKIDIREEDLNAILSLLQDSFLIKNLALALKDLFIKVYYSSIGCCGPKKIVTIEKI